MSEQPDNQANARVLVIEDDESVRTFLLHVLRISGYAAQATDSGEAALKVLERELFDLVLLDINFPGMGGLEVLAVARALQTDAQFIMMSGSGTIGSAVEAMKLGAFDYISKPIQVAELRSMLQRALEETEQRREVAQLRREPGSRKPGGIVGKSPALRRMQDLIERVAPTRSTVLITGETGTGKELVARAIHELSDRARGPFVPINCSALPETLLEAELFGSMKGSFTGATSTKRGLFEQANGGTLFLDEIATISPAIQVKLLRVLQERKIRRIGADHDIPCDFRLLAATNVDLAGEVEAGRFREDLFYRLIVFPIAVPPLRERKSDIPLLAEHFRTRYAREHGVEPPEIPPETMERLMEQEWSGNIRELEHFIERGVTMHAGARIIPFERPTGSTARQPERDLLGRARRERWSLERLEREYILDVLQETRGHQIQAAEILGVDRRTLYRKLKQYSDPCDTAGASAVAC